MESKLDEVIAGHRDRNAALLEDLRRRGIHLDEPYKVEHHFWAPDQRRAAHLARRLYDLGHLVLTISRASGEDGALWNVEAEITGTLRVAAAMETTERLVRLAAEYDATYDGWGVSV